jgi:hypothetical protein
MLLADASARLSGQKQVKLDCARRFGSPEICTLSGQFFLFL